MKARDIMTTEVHTLPPKATISEVEREQIRRQVARAGELIAPNWPIRTIIARNPLAGLEHKPFHEAVREAQAVFGGRGYFSLDELRAQYARGRITKAALLRALHRVTPEFITGPLVQVGSRRIEPAEILFHHLLHGIEATDPTTFQWRVREEGVTRRLRQDLPADLKERLRDRAQGERTRNAGRGDAIRGDSKRDPEADYAASLWMATLTALSHAGMPEEKAETQQAASAPEKLLAPWRTKTLGKWLEALTGINVVEQLNEQMIKWCAAFLDEGLAGWGMPDRAQGFYLAWRDVARHDRSVRLLGLRDFPRRVQALPANPEETVVSCLRTLGIPEDHWTDYFARHLAHLPGWAGVIRWRALNPDYPWQHEHPIDLVGYLAVRLFYEVALVQSICRTTWGIDGSLSALLASLQAPPAHAGAGTVTHHTTHPESPSWICRDAWRLFQLAQFLELSPDDVRGLPAQAIQALLGLLDALPPEAQAPVWQEAYEEQYQQDLLGKLAANSTRPRWDERPEAQAAFCIDVRSEVLRRHLEAQGPYETLGFAGFFGVLLAFTPFDRADTQLLCPVIIKPKYAATEIPRADHDRTLRHYLSGSRWHQVMHHVVHDLKHSPLASYLTVDFLGWLFGLALVGKTLARGPYARFREQLHRWLGQPVATRIPIEKPSERESEAGPKPTERAAALGITAQGFTLAEQATIVETALRLMGLTRTFARLVLFCGHGSTSDNNPFAGALDCGACGGSPGGPNARVLAAMANRPAVRVLLRERGLAIPEDTWFLAGKHDTTRDQVLLYDLEDLPASHRQDVRRLLQAFERAGGLAAQERCARLPGAPKSDAVESAVRHVQQRSVDWAQVRPEWGLSGNAAYIIGQRSVSYGLNLEGRVFMHSYDPEADEDGQRLEFLMTFPGVVMQMISAQYYFSAVDPWIYGSGSKVIHNVVGGIGVMLGRQSDLMTGLPVQSLHDGLVPYHEPLRLLAIIEAPPARIEAIIQRHRILQNFFNNQWVHLVAMDSLTREFSRYRPGGGWVHLSPELLEVP